MKHVTLSQVKQDLAKCLKTARRETVVITSRGKPAGLLIGLESDEELWEYQLINDPRFLRRIEQSRASVQAGNGIPLEDIDFKTGKVASRTGRKRRT